jgi:hypothetical protein
MAKKTGPVSKGEPHRRVIASFKATAEFDAWMERLAKHCRLPVSTLLEHGLIALAREKGFNEEPPER